VLFAAHFHSWRYSGWFKHDPYSGSAGASPSRFGCGRRPRCASENMIGEKRLIHKPVIATIGRVWMDRLPRKLGMPKRQNPASIRTSRYNTHQFTNSHCI